MVHTHNSSRSVFERALDVEPTNIKLWLSYTEMVRAGTGGANLPCGHAHGGIDFENAWLTERESTWPPHTTGTEGAQHLARPQPL